MNLRLILCSPILIVALSGCASSSNATVESPTQTSRVATSQVPSADSSSRPSYSADDGPPNTDLAREEYLELNDIDPESVLDDEVFADLDSELDVETRDWEDAERDREQDQAFFESD